VRKWIIRAVLVIAIVVNAAIAARPLAAGNGLDPTVCFNGSTYYECCWSCNWPYSMWCDCEY
jgi:hypothetical protein